LTKIYYFAIYVIVDTGCGSYIIEIIIGDVHMIKMLNKKKLLAGIVTAVMAFSVCAVAASASSNYNFSLSPTSGTTSKFSTVATKDDTGDAIVNTQSISSGSVYYRVHSSQTSGTEISEKKKVSSVGKITLTYTSTPTKVYLACSKASSTSGTITVSGIWCP
jgi:hypothetical protein